MIDPGGIMWRILCFVCLVFPLWALPLKEVPWKKGAFPNSGYVRLSPGEILELKEFEEKPHHPGSTLDASSVLEVSPAGARLFLNLELACATKARKILAPEWQLLSVQGGHWRKEDEGYSVQCPEGSREKVGVEAFFSSGGKSQNVGYQIPEVFVERGLGALVPLDGVKNLSLGLNGKQFRGEADFPLTDLASRAYISAWVPVAKGLTSENTPLISPVEAEKRSLIHAEVTHSVTVTRRGLNWSLGGELEVSIRPLKEFWLEIPEGARIQSLQVGGRNAEFDGDGRVSLPLPIYPGNRTRIQLQAQFPLELQKLDYSGGFGLVRLKGMDSMREWLSFQILDAMTFHEPGFEEADVVVRADPTELPTARVQHEAPVLFAYRLLQSPGRIQVQGELLQPVDLPGNQIVNSRLQLTMNADGSALGKFSLFIRSLEKELYRLPVPEGMELQSLSMNGVEVGIQMTGDGQPAVMLPVSQAPALRDMRNQMALRERNGIRLEMSFLMPQGPSPRTLRIPLKPQDRRLQISVGGEVLQDHQIRILGPTEKDSIRPGNLPGDLLGGGVNGKGWLIPLFMILLLLVVEGKAVIRRLLKDFAENRPLRESRKHLLFSGILSMTLILLCIWLPKGHLWEFHYAPPFLSYFFENETRYRVHAPESSEAMVAASLQGPLEIQVEFHPRFPAPLVAPLVVLAGFVITYLPMTFCSGALVLVMGVFYLFQTSLNGSVLHLGIWLVLGAFLGLLWPLVYSLRRLLPLFLILPGLQAVEIYRLEDSRGEAHFHIARQDYQKYFSSEKPEPMICQQADLKYFEEGIGLQARLRLRCPDGNPLQIRLPSGWILVEGEPEKDREFRYYLASSMSQWAREKGLLQSPELDVVSGSATVPCAWVHDGEHLGMDQGDGLCRFAYQTPLDLVQKNQEKAPVTEVAEVQKREVKLQLSLRIEEGRADSLARLDLDLQGEVSRELLIHSEGSLVPIRVEGTPRPQGFRMVRGGILVSYHHALPNRVRLDIEASGPLEKSSLLGLPHLANQTAYEASIELEVSPDIQLQAGLSKGLMRLSEGAFEGFRLGPVLSTKALPEGEGILLKTQARLGLEPATAHVDEMHVQTYITDSGEWLLARRILLRASGRQHLGVGLLPGEKIMGIAVQGNQVPAGLQESRLKVPLPEIRDAHDEAATVVVDISSALQPESPFSHPDLEIPGVDLPVANATVCLGVTPSREQEVIALEGLSPGRAILNPSRQQSLVRVNGDAGLLPAVPVVSNESCFMTHLLPQGQSLGRLELKTRLAHSDNLKEWWLYLGASVLWVLALVVPLFRGVLLVLGLFITMLAVVSQSFATTLALPVFILIPVWGLSRYSNRLRERFGRLS